MVAFPHVESHTSNCPDVVKGFSSVSEKGVVYPRTMPDILVATTTTISWPTRTIKKNNAMFFFKIKLSRKDPGMTVARPYLTMTPRKSLSSHVSSHVQLILKSGAKSGCCCLRRPWQESGNQRSRPGDLVVPDPYG